MKEISYGENIDILNKAEEKYISKYISDKIKTLLQELEKQPKITIKLPDEVRLEYFDNNGDKYIDLIINSSNHTANLTYMEWSDKYIYNDVYDLREEILELAGKINDIVDSYSKKYIGDEASDILNDIFARVKEIKTNKENTENILENIPTEVLQEEIERRKKEEIPGLVKQINNNLNKLQQYGYCVYNGDDDTILLNYLKIENNRINYYEFFTS